MASLASPSSTRLLQRLRGMLPCSRLPGIKLLHRSSRPPPPLPTGDPQQEHKGAAESHEASDSPLPENATEHQLVDVAAESLLAGAPKAPDHPVDSEGQFKHHSQPTKETGGGSHQPTTTTEK